MKNYTKHTMILLSAFILICSALMIPTLGFKFGQSAAGADYAVFEGVASSDYYDSMQYSYKINQWASEVPLTGYVGYPWDPSDDWFDANKSLRLGVTEYGELATPQHSGIAYGEDTAEWEDTESWASVDVLEKYWIQGWTFFMNYTRQGIMRAIEAYAIYSDLSVAESARKVYSWYGQYNSTQADAVLTNGTLIPSGVKILYDSARLGVARIDVAIHDGYYDEDVAKVVITVIFNKCTKYAIILKDVKILLDPKVLDLITDFCFSERYELDMARGINPSNEAFVHYFHNSNTTVYQHPLTGQDQFDVVQAFNPDEEYLFFAGYWPNATEYTVYNPLVPNVPLGYTRILNWGTAVPDIPFPPDGPGEPSTPWVIVQWRYNSSVWGNLLSWLAKAANRQMRFVEVAGMTDYTDNPNLAHDVNAHQLPDQLDTEVQYLLNQVFNPEDLNTIASAPIDGEYPFMWTGLGQSAATTDSGGAGLVGGNGYGYHATAFTLFDRNDTMFPWVAPVVGMKGTIPYGLIEFGGNYYESFSNSGKGTGTDTTLYKRTALKDFVFDVYDDDYLSPPQPIAGGWSYNGSLGDSYWYPSKDPLTERWWYNGTGDDLWYTATYDDVLYHPNGILSLGGMKANGLTRYFNDFGYAISREGTAAYALVNAGAVTGTAPTSDMDKSTFDYFPLSTWKVDVTTFGYKEGYAVISLARDVNGTRGLSIYGWDGRDTFWATAWASQYIIGSTTDWLPDGAVALILKITYTTADREPTGFTVVKALGTITEFGDNSFDTTYGFDTGVDWTGGVIEIALPLPWGIEDGNYPVWWYEKLPTESTAKVEFDP